MNISEDENYKKANEILGKITKKEVLPRSPFSWNRQQYMRKGTTLFLSSLLATVALTQAILTFDWISMLTYLFSVIMSIIFGLMQMKSAEYYWTNEYYQYALQE